ncbi:hypothetical protein [Aquimarina pacifica]|uniref:hypothetical protein n=1 Tax=Aquimarina pacifica TaxID=1296415 RepID=UPI0012690509|nr:hypothetical protein [Aquimarina pacifica]
MENKYIELKRRRDLGDMISTYFDFFKQNLKSFTNIFINYNGILILLLLGASYLMVTGFMGMLGTRSGFGNPSDLESNFYIGLGAIIFFFVLVMVAALNYSLASAYMITYDKDEKIVDDKTKVWDYVKNNLGRIIVFILLLFAIYIAYTIVAFIFIIIPIIGALAQYVLNFALLSWLGISFMVMLNEDKSPTDALGEGWDLVKSNFWKCVGVNFILGLLIGLLLILLLVIPGTLVGFYSFHAVDTGVNMADSPVAKIIYTFSLCLVLIVMAYSQSLSQFINGILYFSLHEEKYNINTRSKIDQIGAGE